MCSCFYSAQRVQLLSKLFHSFLQKCTKRQLAARLIRLNNVEVVFFSLFFSNKHEQNTAYDNTICTTKLHKQLNLHQYETLLKSSMASNGIKQLNLHQHETLLKSSMASTDIQQLNLHQYETLLKSSKVFSSVVTKLQK